jgi:SAM-dependent methyltransferase
MFSRTTLVQSSLPVIRNMQRMAPDDYYDRIESWSSSARYAREIEALLRRLDLPSGADLLDVGCGTGTATQFASRCGLRVVGLDRPALWEVRCSVRPIVRADAVRLPFRCASFDGALLFHVLAHLFAPEICLSEIRRVLRGAGRIAISTPNAEYLATLKATCTAPSCYVPDPTVYRHFTAAQVKTLLSTSGFEVRYASTFDPFPNAAVPGRPGERLFFVAERNEDDTALTRPLTASVEPNEL